ncbi:MAG: tripartite tricarboxylate transporter TctB family protein [Candidatus Methylomirabilales bacterium]
MRKRDIVSSLVWTGLGALFALGAWQQGLMRRGVPGPGFLPFFSGLVLVGVSLAVLVPALLGAPEAKVRASASAPGSRRRVLLALGALAGYGIALEYLGYLLTTLLFMLSMGQLIQPRRWGMVSLLAGLTALCSYVLFVILLEVPLPKGVLAF